MFTKDDLNLARENAELAQKLIDDNPTQKKIYQILAVVFYTSTAYTAYRFTRRAAKLVRRNK